MCVCVCKGETKEELEDYMWITWCVCESVRENLSEEFVVVFAVKAEDKCV